MNDQLKEKVFSFLKGWGYSIIIAVAIATSFKSAIADWNDVPTGSMEPTILIGDRVFVNKLAYDLKVPYTTWHITEWDHPKRGDIVVFFSPVNGQRLIKRVVGLPGDTITVQRNLIAINGNTFPVKEVKKRAIYDSVSEAFEAHRIYTESFPDKDHLILLKMDRFSHLREFGPKKIPEGSYFMMGDNRDNSADSRVFGFVTRDRIVGKALAVVISRDKSFFISPRWDRFFKKLN